MSPGLLFPPENLQCDAAPPLRPLSQGARSHPHPSLARNNPSVLALKMVLQAHAPAGPAAGIAVQVAATASAQTQLQQQAWHKRFVPFIPPRLFQRDHRAAPAAAAAAAAAACKTTSSPAAACDSAPASDAVPAKAIMIPRHAAASAEIVREPSSPDDGGSASDGCREDRSSLDSTSDRSTGSSDIEVTIDASLTIAVHDSEQRQQDQHQRENEQDMANESGDDEDDDDDQVPTLAPVDPEAQVTPPPSPAAAAAAAAAAAEPKEPLPPFVPTPAANPSAESPDRHHEHLRHHEHHHHHEHQQPAPHGLHAHDHHRDIASTQAHPPRHQDHMPCALVANFPPAGRSVLDRAVLQNVALGEVFFHLHTKTLTGSVFVRNLHFEKRVCIRYSMDYWASFRDIDSRWCRSLRYKPNHAFMGAAGSSWDSSRDNEVELDQFEFAVDLADYYQRMILDGNPLHKPETIQFALFFVCQNKTHWDNNQGANYTCRLSKYDVEASAHPSHAGLGHGPASAHGSHPDLTRAASWTSWDHDFDDFDDDDVDEEDADGHAGGHDQTPYSPSAFNFIDVASSSPSHPESQLTRCVRSFGNCSLWLKPRKRRTSLPSHTSSRRSSIACMTPPDTPLASSSLLSVRQIKGYTSYDVLDSGITLVSNEPEEGSQDIVYLHDRAVVW